MGPRERNAGLVALAASIAVHCAFGAWTVWRPVREEKPRSASIEFDLITVTAPEPKPDPEQLEPEPEPRPQPKPVAVFRPPRAPKPPPEVSPAPIAPLPTRAPDRAAEDPGEDVPRATVSLVPRSSFAISLDAGVIDVEAEAQARRGLQALAPPKDLIGALAKETIGKGRVERGLVHPYYSQLGKALLKNWDADRVAKNGLKGLLVQTGENMKLYNELWAERAAIYGRSGNPLGDAPSTTDRRGAISGAVSDRIGGITGVDTEQRKELQRQMREAYKATRRAVIKVVQDQNGKLLSVELVQPSSDANVDKEALADVRSAAEKLPPPPPEALEGRTTISSIWSFELIVSISPPVPSFTFEFDEALGFIDVRLPLDRRIYKKVRLVSVE